MWEATAFWNIHSVDLLYLEHFRENFETGVPTNASGNSASGRGHVMTGGSAALGLELKGKMELSFIAPKSKHTRIQVYLTITSDNY